MNESESSSVAEVFAAIVGRLASRADDIARFCTSGYSFEDWCMWEAFASCNVVGWNVRPKPAYRQIDANSSDLADLAIATSPAAKEVFVEIAIVHDQTYNKWIDKLNRDHEKLQRLLTHAIPLQVIIACSCKDLIDEAPNWVQWFACVPTWNMAQLRAQTVSFEPVGSLAIRGWTNE